jgi:hypothetical protein
MNKLVSVYDNTVSARSYISYIAEQAGGFALIGRDGKLYIKTIGENVADLPIKYFKDFKFGEMFKVSRIRYEDGVQLFEKGTTNHNTVYINQDNMYIVDQEQIDNIYNALKDMEVYSFEGTSIIDPALDIGDLLQIGNKYVIYQGNNTYVGKWQASISSNIQCKNKEETTRRVPSQKTINRRVESRINQAEGKIEQVVEEQGEYDQKLAKVEQDVNSINQNVKNIFDFSRETLSKGLVHLENCNDGTGYVEEVSIRDVAYLTPSETLTPNEYLVPFADYFTLVIDKTSRENKTTTAVELRINLATSLKRLNLEIYDEINISNDGTIKLIRRVGKNENGELYELEEATSETLGNLIVPTYDPDTYIYIKENANMNIYVKWTIKNGLDDKYATKLELSSSISQTSEEIMTEVNKKVNDSEFGTKIQQNSEAVKIAWNQISEYIQAMITNGNASLAILDKNKKIMMALDKTGQHFYKEDGNTIFGDMGVQKKDNDQFIAFSILSEYGQTTTNGMAWGIKTKSDDKFYPILHIKDFAMGNKNAGGGYGQLVLSACDIILNGISTGIISGNVKMYGDVDGIVFKDIENNENLLKISDLDMTTLYPKIDILDKMSFYKNEAGTNTFKVGSDDGWVAITSDGNVLCTGVVLDHRSVSDIRLKKNIKDTQIKALKAIRSIKHRQFDWKKDDKHANIGYIAQEMQEINKDFVIEPITEDGNYHINELSILATATKAIQELDEKLNKQTNTIELLKRKIEELEGKLNV